MRGEQYQARSGAPSSLETLSRRRIVMGLRQFSQIYAKYRTIAATQAKIAVPLQDEFGRLPTEIDHVFHLTRVMSEGCFGPAL